MVAATARLVDTICWDGVVVDAGAELIGCVVTDGVHVPAGTRLSHACLLPAAAWPAGPHDTAIGALVAVPLARPGGAPG